MKRFYFTLLFVFSVFQIYAQIIGPESITYNNNTKKYYLSSARNGTIYSFDIENTKATHFKAEKTGLGFPRGMDYYNNNIYVTEAPVKDIIMFNAHSGQIMKRFIIKSSKDLNDVLVSDTLLFASDLKGNSVWMIDTKRGTYMKILKTNAPNGLAIEKNNILWIITFTDKSKLIAYDLKEKKIIKTVPLKYSYGDGLQIMPDGKFVMSFWGKDFKTGKVVIYDINTDKYTTIAENIKGPADLLLHNGKIIIPLMTENKVIIKNMK